MNDPITTPLAPLAINNSSVPIDLMMAVTADGAAKVMANNLPILRFDPHFVVSQVTKSRLADYRNVVMLAGAAASLQVVNHEMFRVATDRRTLMSELRDGYYASIYGVPIYSDSYLMYPLLDRRHLYFVATNDANEIGAITLWTINFSDHV